MFRDFKDSKLGNNRTEIAFFMKYLKRIFKNSSKTTFCSWNWKVWKKRTERKI